MELPKFTDPARKRSLTVAAPIGATAAAPIGDTVAAPIGATVAGLIGAGPRGHPVRERFLLAALLLFAGGVWAPGAEVPGKAEAARICIDRKSTRLNPVT